MAGMEDLNGLRVLVVEDEALVAMDIEFMLEDAGATVVGLAVDNVSAKAYLEHESIDVVLLDYNLADGEADTTAEAAQKAGIPVLFHSGHASRTRLMERFPNAELLSKPVPMQELTAGIARAASRRSMQSGGREAMRAQLLDT